MQLHIAICYGVLEKLVPAVHDLLITVFRFCTNQFLQKGHSGLRKAVMRKYCLDDPDVPLSVFFVLNRISSIDHIEDNIACVNSLPCRQCVVPLK